MSAPVGSPWPAACSTWRPVSSLAVVDPGVGTARRGVAVEVGGGQAVLIGPDNGLLAPAVALVGGADRAVALTNPEFQLPAPGATFAGRDIFAPAAAHLCNGVPFDALGDARPDAVACSRASCRSRGRRTAGSSPRSCGSTGTATPSSTSTPPTSPAGVTGSGCGGATSPARRSWPAPTRRSAAGQVGLVTDSYGLLSIAVDRGSAAAELGLDAGTGITLEPLGDEDSERTSATVSLRPRKPA